MEDNWQELLRTERERFPVLRDSVYLETAGTGLIPDYVYEGVKKYQDDRYYIGGDSDWGDGKGTLDMMWESKESLGQMIHAQPEDLAFGNNSSQMFNLFVQGIGLQPGDNVVLTTDGWIGTRYAWQFQEQYGVQLRYVQPERGVVTPERLLAQCDERTRAISVNYVESTTGFRVDAAAIGRWCHEKGIWFAVDGVQALGILSVDVVRDQIDFLVGSDYKWMMHYSGLGYAYVSPRLRRHLRQWGAGWMSDSERFCTSKAHLTLREDAGRYELGYPTVGGIFALGMVARHYLDLGERRLEDHMLDLMEVLYTEVEKIPGAQIWNKYQRKNRSTITVVLLSEELQVTQEKLDRARVKAHLQDGAAYGAYQCMRISLHYYNNREDILAYCQAIRDCCGESSEAGRESR